MNKYGFKEENMNQYDTFSMTELIDIINARDVEIRILSRSCQRILKEKFKWENKAIHLANDMDLTRDDLFKDEKDSELSSIYSNGEGQLVIKNSEGEVYLWD